MIEFIDWLRKNIIQILNFGLIVYVIVRLNGLEQKVEDAKSEASFTNSKLDYVESEISEYEVKQDTQKKGSN